jgi:radical SAM superfamily enzyme YgiQ (UPF0313 family)
MASTGARPIVLIRPPVLVAKWAHTTPTCPPVGLAYVASSLIAAGWPVAVVDAVGESPEQFVATADKRFLSHGLTTEEIAARIDETAAVIGISCMFSHEWPLVRELIANVKKRAPSAVIVAGGEHVTALPEQSLDSCAALDVGVLGEGEEVMVELVRAISEGRDLSDVKGIVYRNQQGQAVRTPPHPRIRAVDDIPEPAWDLFPISVYLDKGYGFGVNRGRSMPIVATRGCPYSCTFCSSPSMWGTSWLARDPARVLAEIRSYMTKFGAENIDFYDLTAIVKKDWVIQFSDLIEASGVNFTWQLPSGTRSEAIDAEVTRRLYASGCRNMSYAPESGSPETLKRIKKKVKLDRMKTSMREAIAQGINCKANIIIGFPGETHRNVWETLKFCAELALLGLHDLSISPFSPYPGSELYTGLITTGRIGELTDNYYFSLAAYTDITETISYSEHISNRSLNFYRTVGQVMFYAVLYGFRPWRLVQTIRNVFSERQESRLEMSLRDLAHRVFRTT